MDNHVFLDMLSTQEQYDGHPEFVQVERSVGSPSFVSRERKRVSEGEMRTHPVKGNDLEMEADVPIPVGKETHPIRSFQSLDMRVVPRR